MLIFFSLNFCLFVIGAFGMFLTRKNLIIILISLEIILLSANLNFLIGSVFLDDITGQIFALLILTTAAAESALGLAILIIYYRLRGGISLELITLLKS